MVPDATAETEDGPVIGIERPRSGRMPYRLERQLLSKRIDELERELQRERRHRQQIIEQYERLLAEH